MSALCQLLSMSAALYDAEQLLKLDFLLSEESVILS